MIINEREVIKEIVINEREAIKEIVINEREVMKEIVINEREAMKEIVINERTVVNSMVEVIKEMVDTDCYDKISQNSYPRKLTKAEFANAFQTTLNDLCCMVSGISFSVIKTHQPSLTDSPITLAHIVARNATPKEKVTLGFGISGIDSIRNCLILCKGFEEAFDRKFISFVPADNPFSSNRYVLKIWNDGIRTETIYTNATQTIGDFDHFPLILSVNNINHDPFKRALSYQAYRAFNTWHKAYGLSELPIDSDTSVYFGDYKQMRAEFIQRLARDISDEIENDDT